jgi:hypothetical protein
MKKLSLIVSVLILASCAREELDPHRYTKENQVVFKKIKDVTIDFEDETINGEFAYIEAPDGTTYIIDKKASSYAYDGSEKLVISETLTSITISTAGITTDIGNFPNLEDMEGFFSEDKVIPTFIVNLVKFIIANPEYEIIAVYGFPDYVQLEYDPCVIVNGNITSSCTIDSQFNQGERFIHTMYGCPACEGGSNNNSRKNSILAYLGLEWIAKINGVSYYGYNAE